MDVLRADAEALCQHGLQTARVQNRTGANDLPLRQAGDLMENIGQHIDRVGDNDINGVGRHLDDLRRDILEDVDICLRQLKTGLAGFSGHTGGNDYDIRIRSVFIFTGADDGRRAERRALIDIHCLAEGLLLVDVHEKDLRGDALNHQIVCDRCADASRANDGNLAHKNHPFKIVPLRCIRPNAVRSFVTDKIISNLCAKRKCFFLPRPYHL